MLKCVKKCRQGQAQESRRKLMDSALSLFATKGYAGTNTRAICRGAGVADGLLYHYFPGGKQELLREILREKLAQVESELQQWDSGSHALSLEEALEYIFASTLGMFEENFELFRLLSREDEVSSTLACGPLQQMLQLGRQRLSALLEQQMPDIPDTDCAADILISLVTNYFQARLIGLDDNYYTQEHCRRMLRHQCALLRKLTAAPAERNEDQE